MKFERTHGGKGTRLYKAWINMRQRCANPNGIGFHRYGGRGISVCAEWENSFEAFRDWAMANGYRDDLTLDRKDNDKGYSPDNCRWATDEKQANNRGTNHTLTAFGETLTISEWAKRSGLRKSTIRTRIERDGWSPERAVSTPSRRTQP